ncbi:unnamed protein product, partial [Ectocarpus sp. 13 AM-2016]
SSLLSASTRRRRMLEMLLILILGLSVVLDASAVNECLDATDADRCQANTALGLRSCGITDADFDDLASCLEAAGPETITYLSLASNELTTLPEGIFGGLTALETLFLSDNELTTLPEGIFGGLPALELLYLYSNKLTTLPAGIFGGLTALEILYLYDNVLTVLPEGVFGDLTALEILHLEGNSLECLPSTTLLDSGGLLVSPNPHSCQSILTPSGCPRPSPVSIMEFTRTG